MIPTKVRIQVKERRDMMTDCEPSEDTRLMKKKKGRLSVHVRELSADVQYSYFSNISPASLGPLSSTGTRIAVSVIIGAAAHLLTAAASVLARRMRSL